MSRILLTICVISISFIGFIVISEACNEAVCASVVSKCILLKACGCEVNNLGNCTCCKNCSLCLSKLYVDCCSCVGMCPQPKLDDSYKSSSIEDLPLPIPELFDVLTEVDSPEMDWSIHRYPTFKGLLKYIPSTNRYSVDMESEFLKGNLPSIALKNCTVAFMKNCMSLRQCKSSCKSMGAARMRWFHDDTCCQCIGSTCFDYGLNESRCTNCPEAEEDDLVVETGDYDNDAAETDDFDID